MTSQATRSTCGERQTRVIVIGPRSVKQGTGPFVVQAFARSGAQVVALVGTSSRTVGEALRALAEHLAADCRGYTSLDEAVARSRADAVAICSPYRFHAEQLSVTAAAGLHGLCEKPLCWPDEPVGDGLRSDGVLGAFEEAGRRLDLITQWPTTLGAFDRLYPGVRREGVERFEMKLSPVSEGIDMVPDAGPHWLSMLLALCGPGELVDITVDASAPSGVATPLRFQAGYRHEGGTTAATLELTQCLSRPRPAWYAINGKRADRLVELPAYRQFLRSRRAQQPLADPLVEVVGRFLRCVERGEKTNASALRCQQRNLNRLADAVRAHGAARAASRRLN